MANTTTPFRPGPYDAFVRALRADPAVASIRLSSRGGALDVAFATGVTMEIAPIAGAATRATAYLSCLSSAQRGRGHAGRAMRAVRAHADATGTTLRLHARPFAPGGLGADALVAFYVRHGFVRDRDGMMTAAARATA